MLIDRTRSEYLFPDLDLFLSCYELNDVINDVQLQRAIFLNKLYSCLTFNNSNDVANLDQNIIDRL